MVNRDLLRLPDSCYFKSRQEKDLIVLHFTAGGSARSSFDWWRKSSNRVSTPYLIDMDGSVYEVYDPENWSYQLGIQNADANHSNDKRSIGIEICNYGPLKLKGDTLYSWPKDFNNKYCELSQGEKYVKTSFRGFNYYAAFTEFQKASTSYLVDELCSKFGIKSVIAPEPKRNECDVPFFSKWKGICTHANFRPDKFDMSWDVVDKAWLGL